VSESHPIKVLVSGATGRMGRAVARLVEADPAFELIGGIDREDASAEPFPVVASMGRAGELLDRADVVIDFSAPALLAELLRARRTAGITSALVSGTTGLGEAEGELLQAETSWAPVLTAANFSLGINLLVQLSERVARILGSAFDVEIVEAHHRRKEDAPSGTALAIGEAVASGLDEKLAAVRIDGRSGRPGPRPSGQIALHAVRGGDVVGDHHVHFLGDLERLELTHRASDRAVFAAGAVHAARWLTGRAPGRYTMKEVLNL
jgi:4-hydroxy-tetrahydrodipicolinate reductase